MGICNHDAARVLSFDHFVTTITLAHNNVGLCCPRIFTIDDIIASVQIAARIVLDPTAAALLPAVQVLVPVETPDSSVYPGRCSGGLSRPGLLMSNGRVW